MAPWALTWADCAHFQHLFHVTMNLIYHRWRDSPESLLEGLIINDFDLMFHQISTALLPRFQGKDVMVFS